MPGRERFTGEDPKEELMRRMQQRAKRFKNQGQKIDRERAHVARTDLKLFDSLHDGRPTTVYFSDQAPLVIFKGDVWTTGISHEAYRRQLSTNGAMRKLTEKEVISFYEKLSSSQPEIVAGFVVHGFVQPMSFQEKR